MEKIEKKTMPSLGTMGHVRRRICGQAAATPGVAVAREIRFFLESHEPKVFTTWGSARVTRHALTPASGRPKRSMVPLWL